MGRNWKHRAQYGMRNLLRRRGFELVRVSRGLRAESLLALHLSKLFPVYGVDLVLDVGARIGDYGLWLRVNGYSGTIISFEPVSGSFATLSARADADPHWHAIQTALGSVHGTASINVTRQTVFCSFLSPNQFAFDELGDGPEIDYVEEVATNRLDGLLPELLERYRSKSVYLKMDTQGWDLEVLAGATGVLDHIVAFQSEVCVLPIYSGMPALKDSLARFRELQFSLSGLFPVTLDSRNRVIEFDCVCVREAASSWPQRHRRPPASGPEN
jgi:FkbM family methyltransferase